MEVAINERSHFGQWQNSRDQPPISIIGENKFLLKYFYLP